jgi:hypothetical protein
MPRPDASGFSANFLTSCIEDLQLFCNSKAVYSAFLVSSLENPPRIYQTAGLSSFGTHVAKTSPD